MSDVLRSTTFQLEFKGEDGVAGIKRFTKAVSDADATVDALSETLGENVSVTYKTVQSTNELTAEARALVNQMERTNKAVKDTIASYRHQSEMIGKNAEQQEQLNAVYKLGVTATDEQKESVLAAVQAYQALVREENEVIAASDKRIAAEREASKIIADQILRTQDLVNEYQRQIAAVGKSADEQERLNAIYKLGANATEAQKQEVLELVNTYQALVREEAEVNAESNKRIAIDTRLTSTMRALNEQYRHQSSLVGKTADEQEQLNAVFRLGAHATEAQKQEVIELVQSYQALRNASTGTQGSFRDLRGVSQQLGWQLQDVAVQAQLGTSAFIIFSQQGSQLAAAFGPTGALVGAFIAVSGAILGSLVPSLKEGTQSMEDMIGKVDELGLATKQLAEIELRKKIADDQKRLTEIDSLSTLGFLQDKQKSGIELTEKETIRLLELQKQRETLSASILQNESYLDRITKSYTQNVSATEAAAEATNELLTQYGIEFKQLKMNDRQIAIDNALRELGAEASKEQRDEVTKSINKYYDEKDALEASEEALKSKIKTEKVAVNEAEKIAKQRFAAFEAETKSLIKQTETIDQEYSRRKSIVDDFVKFEGTSKRTDEAYAALEQWKTDRLTEQYNKREAVRKQIEQAQRKQAGKEDPVGFENELYQRNIKALESQKQQNELKLAEEQRINALIEAETERHTDRLDEINNNLWIDQLETYGTFVDGIGGVFNRMQDFAEEGSKAAEALFYINQAIAMAQAIISTEVAAAKALELGPILGIPASTVVRGLGYASVGIIAGQTIAGAYDKGGTIPAGQSGIVSEYGDELVNGVLVKGPARVTSREDTAAMMAGGGSSVAITIENRIDGATYRTEQVDETTVRIIAEKVFHDNIDSGVAGTLGNRNSKATKQMKKSFNVRSSY